MADTTTPTPPAAPAEPPPAAPPAPPPAPAPADGTKAALQAQNDLFRAKLIREAVKAAAIPHGIVEPGVLNFVPLKGVTIDDDGNVKGVEDAVTHLRADLPGMFGRQPAAAPAPAPAPQAPAAPATAPVPQTPGSVAAVPPPPPAPQGGLPPHAITRDEWRANRNANQAALIAEAKKRLG